MIDSVFVFKYDTDWVDMYIEGPLYIYERKGSPKYNFYVFNNKGINDFSLCCAGSYNVSLDKDFVRVSNDEGVNYGLWMNIKEKAETLFRVFQAIGHI